MLFRPYHRKPKPQFIKYNANNSHLFAIWPFHHSTNQRFLYVCGGTPKDILPYMYSKRHTVQVRSCLACLPSWFGRTQSRNPEGLWLSLAAHKKSAGPVHLLSLGSPQMVSLSVSEGE